MFLDYEVIPREAVQELLHTFLAQLGATPDSDAEARDGVEQHRRVQMLLQDFHADGFAALLHAARSDVSAALDVLLSHPDMLMSVLAADPQTGRTALHEAAPLGNVSFVRELLARTSEQQATLFICSAQDEEKNTALDLAAAEGRVETVVAILESEGSRWATEAVRKRALRKAVERGHVEVAWAMCRAGGGAA